MKDESIWGKEFSISWPWLFLGLYLLLSIVPLALYVNGTFDPKWDPLVTGVATGAWLAALQFLWAWKEAVGIRKLKKIKVIDVLITRDDEEYYQQLITSSEKKVWVLGTTCKRFLDDFADKSSPRESKRALISAMRKGVVVKLLVATKAGLGDDNESIQKAEQARVRMETLKQEHPEHFDFGYYDHVPMHSVVLIDGCCIVGPTFFGKESRNTPAIVMEEASALASSYVKHFEEEWKRKADSGGF